VVLGGVALATLGVPSWMLGRRRAEAMPAHGP
jgi:hypothetical protein